MEADALALVSVEQLDPGTESFGQNTDDRQAETAALLGRVAVDPIEPLEHSVSFRLGDPGTVIFNHKYAVAPDS